MSSKIAKHITIINDYKKSKAELLEWLKTRIADIGTSNASKEICQSIQYTSDLKQGRKDKSISYYQLVRLAELIENKTKI